MTRRSASATGVVATADVTLTNRSQRSSVYRVTVAWDSSDGVIEEEVSTGYLGVDDSITLTAVELGERADADSCRVTRIERSRFPFF